MFNFKEYLLIPCYENQSWIFIRRTDAEAETPHLATWCEELTHLKRPWCWERLKAEEGDNRGWDGWMASPTQWTWVWINSESWWWTGRPGVLQSMGSQRVRHDWVTELNWCYERWRKEHIYTSCYAPCPPHCYFYNIKFYKFIIYSKSVTCTEVYKFFNEINFSLH